MDDIDVKDKLFIIVTSKEYEVHQLVSFMYSYNSIKKDWMKKIRIIFWGPSQALIVENEEDMKERFTTLKELGIEIYGCKTCSKFYGYTKKLEEIGVTCVHFGQMLTDMLKEGWNQLTF